MENIRCLDNNYLAAPNYQVPWHGFFLKFQFNKNHLTFTSSKIHIYDSAHGQALEKAVTKFSDNIYNVSAMRIS